MKQQMLEVFKLNRRKGVRELSKFLMNEMTDKNSKTLSKQLLGTQQPFKNVGKFKKTDPNTKESIQCSKNYTIDFIK